jgi:hypothetical protein
LFAALGDEVVDSSHGALGSGELGEALYFSIIQHFENAMAWGPALACYKELAVHYEHTTLRWECRSEQLRHRLVEIPFVEIGMELKGKTCFG